MEQRSLLCVEIKISLHQTHALRRTLNEACSNKRLHSLIEAPDQGWAFHLVSKDATSSHLVADGAFMSFNDYKFVLRARLNHLPTKTVAKRVGRPIADDTCSRCKSAPETLAHILNACLINVGLMRERQNYILRFAKAVPQEVGDILLNQISKAHLLTFTLT